eukprot:3517376-Pleurochrysis_carterae.AAC.1
MYSAIRVPENVRGKETPGAFFAKLRLPLPALPQTYLYYLLLQVVNLPLSPVIGVGIPPGHSGLGIYLESK